MAEENRNKTDNPIDALFSSIPSAPGAKKSAPMTPRHEAPGMHPTQTKQSENEKPQSTAGRAPQTAKAQPKQQAITIDELRHALERPQSPVEKAPVWTTVLTVSSMILSFVFMVLAFVGAWWYFRGAVMSQLLCIIFGAVGVAFSLSCAFVLCAIERGIREIKSKL